jgi:hypothetical protein
MNCRANVLSRVFEITNTDKSGLVPIIDLANCVILKENVIWFYDHKSNSMKYIAFRNISKGEEVIL